MRDLLAWRQLVLAVALLVVLAPATPSGRGAAAERLASAVEVPGLRSASSETFVNPDGSFSTRVYASPIHFRDEDGAWRKIDLGFSANAAEGFAVRSGANAFRVDVRDAVAADDRAKGGFLRFERNGIAVGLSLEGAESSKLARVGSSELVFSQVLPDVDLTYALLPDGVKESLVLASAAAPSSYRFVLSPPADRKLRAVPDKAGSVTFYPAEGGEPAFVLLAPVVSDTPSVKPTREDGSGTESISGATSDPAGPGDIQSSMANPLDPAQNPLVPSDPDATEPSDDTEPSTANPLDPAQNPLAPTDPALPVSGATPPGAPAAAAAPVLGDPGASPVSADAVSMSVSELADGSFAVDVKVDPAWLKTPERQFPVVIDPTVLGAAVVQDAYWNTASDSNPLLLNGELWTGSGGGSTYATAVRFDTGVIPPGARVAPTVLLLPSTRRAMLGTVTRPADGKCTVKAPRTVDAQIKGTTYKLAVVAPKELGPGKKGNVSVVFPPATATALAKAKVEIRVPIDADNQKVARTTGAVQRWVRRS